MRPHLPLQGVVIALDPGHELGNARFPQQINRPVPAGGFEKACNTTGTATDAGFPEATLTFDIARVVRRRLSALGAVVKMTRTTNSERRWGPCVDVRGRFGQRVHARLLVSIHGDGGPASGYGFQVIEPRSQGAGPLARASMRLGHDLRHGLERHGIVPSTYVGGGTGMSVRSDLATLNLARVPVAMVEVGNMRNAADAARMTTRRGRDRYAAAMVAGIRRFLSLR